MNIILYVNKFDLVVSLITDELYCIVILLMTDEYNISRLRFKIPDARFVHNITWHDMTWQDMTWHDTTRHDTTRHDTTRHDTAQHCFTLHYTTLHYTSLHRVATCHAYCVIVTHFANFPAFRKYFMRDAIFPAILLSFRFNIIVM